MPQPNVNWDPQPVWLLAARAQRIDGRIAENGPCATTIAHVVDRRL